MAPTEIVVGNTELQHRRVEDLEQTHLESLVQQVGDGFLKAMFKQRRVKRAKFGNLYHKQIRPKIEALITVMIEQDLGPVEAIFHLNEGYDIPLNLSWHMCALVEIIDPTDKDLIEEIQTEFVELLHKNRLGPPKEGLCETVQRSLGLLKTRDQLVLDPSIPIFTLPPKD